MERIEYGSISSYLLAMSSVREEDWTVALRKTAAAWKSGDMADVDWALDDELSGSALQRLESACDSGGWPDDEQIVIENVSVSDDALTADVTVYFTEVIASSCKDMPNRVDREARLVVTLRRGESIGRIEYSDADPSQWDLIDRNSAADGN